MKAYTQYYMNGYHGHYTWHMDPATLPSLSEALMISCYEDHLRTLFDFDNRKQEREEMERNSEDEALLAEAFQALPSYVTLFFDIARRVSISDDGKEADAAITLGKRMNGPRFPLAREHDVFEEETIFESEEVWISRQKLEGIKEGCRIAIKRTIEIGSRAARSAGLKDVDSISTENFLSG